MLQHSRKIQLYVGLSVSSVLACLSRAINSKGEGWGGEKEACLVSCKDKTNGGSFHLRRGGSKCPCSHSNLSLTLLTLEIVCSIKCSPEKPLTGVCRHSSIMDVFSLLGEDNTIQ